MCPKIIRHSNKLLIAIGVITSPDNVPSRTLKRTVRLPDVLLRFVSGEHLCAEQKRCGDIVHINVKENTRYSCAVKSYEWYKVAATYYNVRYIAKADDDTYLFPHVIRQKFADLHESYGSAIFAQSGKIYRVPKASIQFGDWCTHDPLHAACRSHAENVYTRSRTTESTRFA